jgi:hypothetical protein
MRVAAHFEFVRNVRTQRNVVNVSEITNSAKFTSAHLPRKSIASLKKWKQFFQSPTYLYEPLPKETDFPESCKQAARHMAVTHRIRMNLVSTKFRSWKNVRKHITDDRPPLRRSAHGAVGQHSGQFPRAWAEWARAPHADPATVPRHTAAAQDFMPQQERDMIEFMELLAVSETSRRTLLP